MNSKEEFIFGDLSDIDLSDCEEIVITESVVKQPKRTMKKAAASIIQTSMEVQSAPPKLISSNANISSANNIQSGPQILNNSNTVSYDPNRILTVKQAAEYLQISTDTILKRIYNGELAAFKIGNIWRMRQSHIEDYINGKLITK